MADATLILSVKECNLKRRDQHLPDMADCIRLFSMDAAQEVTMRRSCPRKQPHFLVFFLMNRSTRTVRV